MTALCLFEVLSTLVHSRPRTSDENYSQFSFAHHEKVASEMLANQTTAVKADKYKIENKYR